MLTFDIVIVFFSVSRRQTTGVFPASYENVIAVGATDINNNAASFTNFGPDTDVFGGGVSVWSAGSSFSSRCPGGGNNCIVAMSGTSMSCPIVAGQATRVTHVNNNVRFLFFG